MKKFDLALSVFLLPLDILMVLAGFLVAYQLRLLAPVIFIWDFKAYLSFTFTFAVIWSFIFAFLGLYVVSDYKKWLDELMKILIGSTSGIMLVVAWLFISRTDFFSRLVVLYAWAFTIIFVVAGRLVVRIVVSILRRKGIGKVRVLVIGNIERFSPLISTLQSKPSLGIEIVNTISKNEIGKLEQICQDYKVDEIILADPEIAESEALDVLDFAEEKRLKFHLVPNLFRLHSANLSVMPVAGIPLIEFKRTRLEGWGIIIKRLVDIIVSICMIIILSPVMLACAIAVKLTSNGPIIYKNIRVGHKGDFITYKFRTMSADYCTGLFYGGEKADKFEDELINKKNIKHGSAVYKISGDPRITPLGHLLRRYSLDELPQLFNVLKGSMSLVGPRPHQPREVIKYTKEQTKLLLVKPGISGMAQISGRSDLTFDDEAKLDIYYLENWSMWLDIQIMLRTISVVLTSKGAY